jgi:hypothetical protein
MTDNPKVLWCHVCEALFPSPNSTGRGCPVCSMMTPLQRAERYAQSIRDNTHSGSHSWIEVSDHILALSDEVARLRAKEAP